MNLNEVKELVKSKKRVYFRDPNHIVVLNLFGDLDVMTLNSGRIRALKEDEIERYCFTLNRH